MNKPARYIYADAQLVTRFPLAELPMPHASESGKLEIAIGYSNFSVNSRGVARDRSPGAVSAGFHGARIGSRFVFCVSRQADFVVEPDGLAVTVSEQAACSGPALNHWLLDQVLPRVLSHHGRLVMHAAAVRATPDTAVAFLGETGAGKSTLTASLHAAGYPLLSDDALVLSASLHGVMALPTYPSLRLWPDAIGGLYSKAPPVAPVARDSAKMRVSIDTPPQPHGQPVPLVALYLLGCAADTLSNDISITRLSGREACMAIISHTFQLDPADMQRAARLMSAAAGVARRVPAFRLSYPREFARLPDVCAALIEHSRGLAPVTDEAAERV